MPPATTARRHRPGRSRWLRLRALLAGGLVLGIGGAATLAAWNDSEYASSTVTASTFGIEGSVNGGAFAEHASSDSAASLVFNPALPQISPGASGFMRFSVRTTAGSTVGGTVGMQTPTISTDGSTALRDALRYSVRIIPSGSSCNAALFSNTNAPVIVANDTALTATVPSNSRTLQPAASGSADYCVRLSMLSSAGNDAQGRSLTVTWQFLGQSG